MTAKQLNQGYQYNKQNNNIDISIYKDGGVYVVSGFIGEIYFRNTFAKFKDAKNKFRQV